MSDLLRRASALERVLADDQRDADLVSLGSNLVSCAEDLFRDGEAQRALELLEEGRSSLQRSGPDLQVRCLAITSECLALVGKLSESLEQAEEALRRVGEVASLGQAHVHAVVAAASAYSRIGEDERSIVLLQDLRRSLLGRPDSVGLAAICSTLSTCLLRKGARQDAEDAAEEAVISSRRSGSLYWEMLAQHNLAFVRRQACDWKSAIRHAVSEHDLAASLGNAYMHDSARRALSLAFLKRGDLKKAREYYEASLAATYDVPRWRHFAELGLAIVDLQEGNFSETRRRSLEVSEAVGQGRGIPRVVLLAAEYLADGELESGKIEPALEQFEWVWERAFALAPRGDIVAELRRRKAECYLLLGKYERARHEAVEAIDHCREILDRYEQAATYRILALAEAGLGRPDAANKMFHEGFAHYDEIETPFEWGKLWISYGDWLAGDQAGAYFSLSGARSAYLAGIDYFERMGAAYRLQLAREKLANLEARIRAESAADDGKSSQRPRRKPSEQEAIARRSRWAFDAFGIVTENRYLLDQLEQIGRVAVSEMSVLILGESGTGKELVAQGVHELSGRTGRFVPVNCSAMPDTMVESELFGHVQGAFTGAIRDKEGLLEQAERGTMFLDEIGEMSVELQAKLLRAIESKEIRRVGGNAPLAVDTRFVAATNREVSKLQRGEGFREDLFYRLAHGVFELPPLRDRGHDIDLLIAHFTREFCAQYERRLHLTSGARRRLAAFRWPGNVRQLRGVIHKLVAQSEPNDVIKERDVAFLEQPADRPASLEEELRDQERRRILDALQKTHGVRADAARMLGMSRTTMLTKMARLGIKDA